MQREVHDSLGIQDKNHCTHILLSPVASSSYLAGISEENFDGVVEK